MTSAVFLVSSCQNKFVANAAHSKTGAFALPILQDLKLCDDKQQTRGRMMLE
jgi:hypothetical protein